MKIRQKWAVAFTLALAASTTISSFTPAMADAHERYQFMIKKVTPISEPLALNKPNLVDTAVATSACPAIDTRTAILTGTTLTLKAESGVDFLSPNLNNFLNTGNRSLTWTLVSLPATGSISFDSTTSIIKIDSLTAIGSYSGSMVATDSITSLTFATTISVSAPVRVVLGAPTPTCSTMGTTPLTTYATHELSEMSDIHESEEPHSMAGWVFSNYGRVASSENEGVASSENEED